MLFRSVESQNNFALGVLSKALMSNDVSCRIQKSTNHQNYSNACMHLIANGMGEEKQAVLKFDLGANENKKIVNNKSEKKKFIDKWRPRIANELNVDEDKIKVIGVSEGSIDVSFVLKSESVEEVISGEMEQSLLSKYPNEVLSLNVHPVLKACMLTPDSMDTVGNNDNWPGPNEERGGLKYNPPYGWKGYGIKVTGKYDKGNDDWLMMDNRPGEYAVAYHGLRNHGKEAVKNIVGEGQKINPGINQVHENSEDTKHPGNKCGIGTYVTPFIDIAEEYTNPVEFERNGEKVSYRMAFMCRVNPKRIREPKLKNGDTYWILNSNEIRPYRILLKKENS